MRKWLCVPMMTLCVLLAGCGVGENAAGKTDLRQVYQAMDGCVMEAVITGGTEEVTVFTLRCEYTPGAASVVEILAPETAAGIRAVVDGSDLSVVYEDLCLPAGNIGDEKISPAVCLPRMMDILREGWLLEEGSETQEEVPCRRLCLDGSESGTGVESVFWLRETDGMPLRGEIFVDGEIILTAEFTNFQFCDKITSQAGAFSG